MVLRVGVGGSYERGTPVALKSSHTAGSKAAGMLSVCCGRVFALGVRSVDSDCRGTSLLRKRPLPRTPPRTDPRHKRMVGSWGGAFFYE